MKKIRFIVNSIIIILVSSFLLFLINTKLHGYLPLIPNFIIVSLIMIVSKDVRKKYKE